jgi:Sigma-70 region 2/Domain of unknown function (DUF4367)
MDARRVNISFIRSAPAQEDERGILMSEDQRAFFDGLYQQYYPRVLAYLRFRAGTVDIAEDLASMVFERALTHIAELQAPEAAAAWIFRIARNCAADYFRRRRPEVSLEELVTSERPRVLSSEEQVLADEERRILLALKNAGVRPLLPVEVPAGTQSVEFGIITDSTDPRAFTAFVADYRIAGQDVSVYERPADLVFPSSAAQSVYIGSMKGQLFQDDAGNSILQWYQDGMTCQLASTLPANELIAIARQFQPITSWELIL